MKRTHIKTSVIQLREFGHEANRKRRQDFLSNVVHMAASAFAICISLVALAMVLGGIK